jgi:hypothetical protein
MDTHRYRKRLGAIYAVGAIALAPWIAFLWLVEPAHGLAHDVGWLTAGLVVVLAASTMITGVLCVRGSGIAMVAASFTASLALATLWFRLTAPVGSESAFATGRSFVVLILPVVLVAWPSWIWVRDGGTTGSKHLFLAVAYWVSGILLLIGAIRLASVAPSTEVEHHVRLIWTGLDTFELIGLAATAWCIHTCSRWTVLASTFTAALLAADAWTNVASTTGSARTAALAMAVIEISLAVLSLCVAVKLGPDASQTRHRPDVALTIATTAEQHQCNESTIRGTQ